MDLNELKEQTGVIIRKLDKSIKGFPKNKLAQVDETNEGLLISLA